MKKVIVIIAIVLVVVLGVVGIYYFSDHTEVAEGIYKVQEYEKYPDAYIEVKDGKAQFFNIDLNALYKENIVKCYIESIERERKITSSEKKEIENSIDLNKQFCDVSFVLDYKLENANSINSDGIGMYNFGFVTEMDYLAYEYDWKNKSITLVRPEAGRIVFKKE